MPASALVTVAKELCVAVDGSDWDATRVQDCVNRMLKLAGEASPEERTTALGVFAERIRRSSVEDADGVAHVAISGGTLIEKGAHPQALSGALLERLPPVLLAARRFADTCIADLHEMEDPWAGVDGQSLIAEVDGLPITLAALRAHIASDRPGGAALARLGEWTLPTVAALSRDRDSLAMGMKNEQLVDAAAALRDSEASWLHPLLATQLNAPWRVVLVEQQRLFDLRVDEVSTNFDLHALVEKALQSAGIEVEEQPDDGSVRATFELLTAGAGPSLGRAIPAEHVVWREGVPTDVPAFDGVPTLIAARPTIARTWRATPPFSAMTPRVSIERELSSSEAKDFLKALGHVRT